MHKTCSINYGYLADLQKTLPTTDLNKKKTFHLIKYLLATFIFFPFFSICTCGRIVVVMLVNLFMLSLFWPFGFVLSHAISTQHPQTFHPAPPLFLNFPPSINPLLHALKTELFFTPRVCSSATHLFVHFQKYLRTPKQYSSIQQRILAWTNSSRRARRHVWCWVEFHPHHCLRGEHPFTAPSLIPNSRHWPCLPVGPARRYSRFASRGYCTGFQASGLGSFYIRWRITF